jgi:hypothetical protein
MALELEISSAKDKSFEHACALVRMIYLLVYILSITLNVGAPTFFSQTKNLAHSFPTRTRPPCIFCRYKFRGDSKLFKNSTALKKTDGSESILR